MSTKYKSAMEQAGSVDNAYECMLDIYCMLEEPARLYIKADEILEAMTHFNTEDCVDYLNVIGRKLHMQDETGWLNIIS